MEYKIAFNSIVNDKSNYDEDDEPILEKASKKVKRLLEKLQD